MSDVYQPSVSFETYEQAERVFAAAEEAQLNAVPVLGSETGRPLAVVLRGAVDLDDFIPSRPLNRGSKAFRNEVGSHLFVSGDMVAPAAFFHIIDPLAQVASGESNPGLTTNIQGKGNPQSVGWASDLELHIDGSSESDASLSGWNVHLTLAGSAITRFGMDRDGSLAYKLSHLVKPGEESITEDERKARRHQVIEEGVSEFATAVDVGEGDVVLFQAQMHSAFDRLPVLHSFRTTSVQRTYASWGVELGPAEDVHAARHAALQKLGINPDAYAAHDG